MPAGCHKLWQVSAVEGGLGAPLPSSCRHWQQSSGMLQRAALAGLWLGCGPGAAAGAHSCCLLLSCSSNSSAPPGSPQAPTRWSLPRCRFPGAQGRNVCSSPLGLLLPCSLTAASSSLPSHECSGMFQAGTSLEGLFSPLSFFLSCYYLAKSKPCSTWIPKWRSPPSRPSPFPAKASKAPRRGSGSLDCSRIF